MVPSSEQKIDRLFISSIWEKKISEKNMTFTRQVQEEFKKSCEWGNTATSIGNIRNRDRKAIKVDFLVQCMMKLKVETVY